MQVGPSVRGFDADNATAEGAAAGTFTGKIQLHSRVARWKAAAGHNPGRNAQQLDSTKKESRETTTYQRLGLQPEGAQSFFRRAQ